LKKEEEARAAAAAFQNEEIDGEVYLWEDIASEYKSNRSAANNRYINQTIYIRGQVVRIGYTPWMQVSSFVGGPTVTLVGNDADLNSYYLYCQRTHTPSAIELVEGALEKNISEGDTVTVKAHITSSHKNVLMDLLLGTSDCIIVE